MPCRPPLHRPTLGPAALALLVLASASLAQGGNAAAAPPPAGCISDAVVTSDADDGTGTLRSAVAGLCDGGTITFADRIVLELSSEIVVDKHVTIDGSSVAGDASAGGDALVQIRGRTDVRSFRVTTDGDLTLRRLRVSNGVLDDLGGGVRSAGRLAVFDSRFDHNVGGTINGLGGGAIFSALDSVLVVDGSTFDANDAQRGSAIFNSGSAQISNSTFSGNGLTLQREGAIQNRGTLVAVHLTISGNGNNGGFGGVFAFSADTTFANTVIAGNTGTECAISGGTVTSIALLAPGGLVPADAVRRSATGTAHRQRRSHDDPRAGRGQPRHGCRRQRILSADRPAWRRAPERIRLRSRCLRDRTGAPFP